MRRLAVVGGGISGLAAAHFVRSSSPGTDILIFEAESVPGGTMRTAREGGFSMEAGPNGFLTNKPHTLELVRELGCEARLLRSSGEARKRFVYSGGRLFRLPETPGAFLSCGLLSARGRLRVLAEAFAPGPPAGRDETVAEFAVRRLGREGMEKLIEPMTAGVFAGDPDRLSLRACFPRIHELESRYGGLVKAMLSLRWERRKDKARTGMSASPGGVLTSFDTGVQALVEILAERLRASLRLGAEVERVERRDGLYRLAVREGGGLSETDFDAVVVAAPAYAACRLLRALDPELAQDLGRIPYAPIAVAALGYDAAALDRPLDGFGFLVPRLEKRRILGASWDSSVFPGRAPQGRVLVRAMVGGARQPGLALLPEEEVLALARAELADMAGLRAEPVLARVFRHERGIPQYLPGHGALLERIESRLSASPGLILNSNAYRGVSLNDCILQSRRAAGKVLSTKL